MSTRTFKPQRGEVNLSQVMLDFATSRQRSKFAVEITPLVMFV